jgi:hypothetical protein
MTALTNEITYRVQELERVSADLRNERTLGATTDSVAHRVRVALGNALVQVGTALAASQRRVSAEAR